MSRRREYTFAKLCADGGCKEAERTVFDTQREYMEHVRFRTHNPYLCTRHKRPEEVIGVANPVRQITYTVTEDRGDKRWAGPRNAQSWLGGGLDDFQAYADDFPLGTQLTITVALDLPATHGEQP